MITVEEANKVIKNCLSEKRYNHSVCVMDRCIEYAKIYGLDETKASLMGLLHDMAKEMPKEEKVKFCEEHSLEINEIEQKHITLLHAKIAAHIAKNEYELSDDICDAIEYHTTGRKNMTIWDKILYAADATGKDRHYDNTEFLYNLAKEDIDKCVIEILKVSIIDRFEEGKLIHLDSIEAFNDLILKDYE